MTRYLLATLLLAAPDLSAQREGPTPTQTLISLDSKTPQTPTTQNLSIKVNNHDAQISSVVPISPNGAQIALLIDDGLRESVGRNLGDLKTFITSLPPGTEIFIGYMENGRVQPAQEFTTDYAAAANSLRVPLGSPGISASPYFCLSDFAKRWPAPAAGEGHKARFVMMITNGVDPYNGSTSITNQNSPYVDAAITDAQRAGIAVYSIYYADAGFRGQRGSFSGQSYLSLVAEGTGGQAYFEGLGNPVSMAPFLNEFRKAIAETWIATFPAPGNKELVPIKVSTKLSGTKVRAPEQVRPGNTVLSE
ncbi:vWA domain-containing protein [Edaphobacter bradus]|uniref:hypothetical protein n=1 Tax=Edaphobacter bradus TaxID=2259016 RepID=UPI0021E0D4C0|nr:hypothetical protein [Edaphobacter bradus]